MRIGAITWIAVLWAVPALANNVVLTVGQGAQYQGVSEAVAIANADTEDGGPEPFGGGSSQLRNYYTINVLPGIYQNDFSEVRRPMTIQTDPALPGERAIPQ